MEHKWGKWFFTDPDEDDAEVAAAFERARQTISALESPLFVDFVRWLNDELDKPSHPGIDPVRVLSRLDALKEVRKELRRLIDRAQSVVASARKDENG